MEVAQQPRAALQSAAFYSNAHRPEIPAFLPGSGLPYPPRAAPATGEAVHRERGVSSATVLRMSAPPLFADDNSSYRRVMRRRQEEERVREARRREILATLRRLKEEAGDTALMAERERQRRHADLLDRYPPLF